MRIVPEADACDRVKRPQTSIVNQQNRSACCIAARGKSFLQSATPNQTLSIDSFNLPLRTAVLSQPLDVALFILCDSWGM
ncbi:MAG: hypothetical protein KME27_23075 [Lyngbya sp. HA4199-MV5]|nr:hypothetical protein [Lyngbya sp. HA4199-MV5]